MTKRPKRVSGKMKQPIHVWTAGKCDYCKEENATVFRLGDGLICPDCWDQLRKMAKMCENCGAHGIETPATIRAYWIDEEGKVYRDKDIWICQDCLEAGNPKGPGYIRVEGQKKKAVKLL